MVGRLKDKVALVSGAGSSGPGWGNGKATAVLFAREGAKVLAADTRRSCGGTVNIGRSGSIGLHRITPWVGSEAAIPVAAGSGFCGGGDGGGLRQTSMK